MSTPPRRFPLRPAAPGVAPWAMTVKMPPSGVAATPYCAIAPLVWRETKSIWADWQSDPRGVGQTIGILHADLSIAGGDPAALTAHIAGEADSPVYSQSHVDPVVSVDGNVLTFDATGGSNDIFYAIWLELDCGDRIISSNPLFAAANGA